MTFLNKDLDIYDFNGQITSDRQKRIREWAGNTVRRFSIVFSPSILREIPVDLDDNLGLLRFSTRRLQSPK